ncbi:MAG: T9SS type A sorting domain-containing protein [Bacteroidales bacterium]|nr:T9SS type A sorting domain-containing protein [Bacteroidales bacterium]
MTNSTGMLKAFARNILIVNDSLDYAEPIYLPQPGLKSGKARIWPEKGVQAQNFMKIYPNPAKNLVIIEVRLKEIPNNAQVQIINLEGIVLDEIAVNQRYDYIVIPLSEFKSGTYLCKLSIGNKTVETKQFIISRF